MMRWRLDNQDGFADSPYSNVGEVRHYSIALMQRHGGLCRRPQLEYPDHSAPTASRDVIHSGERCQS
jgi:hypothetical protein